MPRLRIAVVLCLSAGVALTPWPHGMSRIDLVEPAPADPAPVPDPAPAEPGLVDALTPALSGPQPFALLARFGETRFRHPAPVRSVVLSPDNRTLATTTETDPFIRLWDATTGQLVREFRVTGASKHTFTLEGTFANGYHLLAVRHKEYSRSDLDTEREWGIIDTRSGDFREIGKLSQDVAPPVVSPNGTMIGGVSEQGELTVWSFDATTPPRGLGSIHPGPLPGRHRVAFSPDSRQFVVCRGDTLYVAPTRGGEVREIKAERRPFYTEVFWPLPGHMLAAHEAMMTAFDPATGDTRFHTDNCKHPQRSNVVIALGVLLGRDNYNGKMFTIEPGQLSPSHAPQYQKISYGSRFVASADGKALAVANGHSIRMLDAETAEPLLPNLDGSTAYPATRIHFSADGKRMLTAGGATMRTWDVPRGRLLASAPIIAESDLWSSSSVAISPDGKWTIASATYDMKTVIRDAETGKVVNTPKQQEDRLLVGLDGPGRVWLVNRHTGEIASHSLPNGPVGPTVLAIQDSTFSSPDSRWFVSSLGRHSLRIRDTRDANSSWIELESYRKEPMGACGRVPPACAIPIRISPDGRYLATWWRGFNLWSLADRRVVRLTSVRDHSWWCPDATFTPDGRRMAAVVDDNPDWVEEGRPGQVRVWETATGSEAFRFDPPGGATGCAFTPDGKRLVVAHPDTTFSVWDYRALESRAVRTAGDIWVRLATRDARVALGAVDALAADPGAVALLRERFRPADAGRVTQHIAELGDEDFATREAAEKSLAALGEHAEKALSQAATGSPSPEARVRANRLLGLISGAHGAARLRAVRAVEVVERIGTPAARDLLTEWAKESGPTLASEAQAALARLIAR